MSDAALTPDALARIEELAEKATPGPWAVNEHYGAHPDREVRAGEMGYDPLIAKELLPGDAEFIAAARTAVPALLSGVRSRDARIAELEAEVAARDAVIEKAYTVAMMESGKSAARILSAAPSSVLAARDAEKWDEGARRIIDWNK